MTRQEVLEQLCDLTAGGLGQVPEGEEAALLREFIDTLTVMAVAYEVAEEGADATTLEGNYPFEGESASRAREDA